MTTSNGPSALAVAGKSWSEATRQPVGSRTDRTNRSSSTSLVRTRMRRPRACNAHVHDSARKAGASGLFDRPSAIGGDGDARLWESLRASPPCPRADRPLPAEAGGSGRIAVALMQFEIHLEHIDQLFANQAAP